MSNKILNGTLEWMEPQVPSEDPLLTKSENEFDE